MKILFPLFVALLIPALLQGQSTLRGVVTDSTSGEKLIGINAFLEGTSIGTVTDIEGNFRISNIPPGTFTVRISCVGYEQKKFRLTFSGNESFTLNVQLVPAIIQGEEVVITAQMRGQIAAINQQITSKTIINVVSEEKIQELPDMNAAEAIGRLPGVALTRSGGEAAGVILRGLSSKFSTITLDGVKIPPTNSNTRDVDLSMISQGALSGIELYKTLTPDQDADAIAGGINLVTRKAPATRLVRVDLKGNHNYLMKSANQYDAQARYGERFFNDLLGFQLLGNIERKIRSKEEYSTGYATSYSADPLWPYAHVGDNLSELPNYYRINSFTVQFTDEIRQRKGMQFILDYNTPDSGTVKMVGMLAQTDRNYTMHKRIYLSWDYTYQNVSRSTATRNIAVQGKNYAMGLDADWLISFAESEVKNPNNYMLEFHEPSGGQSLAPIQDHPERLLEIANNNFDMSTLQYTTLQRLENYDKELTLQFNVSRNVLIGSGINNSLKAGAKYKTKSRWLDNYGFAWNNYLGNKWTNADGTAISDAAWSVWSRNSFTNQTMAALTQFYDPSNLKTRDLLDKYRMMPLINPNRMDEWQSLTKDLSLSQSINIGPLGMNPVDNYFVTENITSGYVMNTMDFGQWLTLIYGVRVEQEKNQYLAHYNVTGPSGVGRVLTLPAKDIIDSTATYETTIWLPNLQMSFKPTEYLTLRAAVYKALARPDFNLRLPQFARSSGGTISLGNPNLQNSTAWNYETSMQLHNGTIGLFTISGFYKSIENMFHEASNIRLRWVNNPDQLMGSIARYPNNFYSNREDGYRRLDRFLKATGLDQWYKTPAFEKITPPFFSDYTITAAYNSPDPSSTWGFELEHQMNFGFLPVKWMQNIVLSYNVTIMRSKTQVWVQNTVFDTTWTPAQYNDRGRKITDSAFTPVGNYEAVLVNRAMEDQPELFGNLSLGYDIAGFSARISMFYQSRYTRSYSTSGESDAIQNEFIKWDLSLKQEITSQIALILNINNIFNREESQSRYNRFYSWGDLPVYAQHYGRTMDLGIRISL